MKSWKIHFSLRKGSFKKFIPQLKYIKRNYKPEYLKISQVKYFDHFNEKPMPNIEFIVYAFNPIHFMDDFIDKFPKLVATGGSEEFHWVKIPKNARTGKIIKYLKEKKLKSKYIAIEMRRRYNMRKKK